MAFLAEIANRKKSDASSASDPSEHNVLFPNASEDFEPFRPSSIVEETIPEDVAATNRGSANFGITGGIKELSDEEVFSDADTSLQELSWDDYIKTQLVEYGGVSEGMIVSLGVGGNPPQVDLRGEVWASTANFTARTESTVTVTNDMGEDEEMTVNEAELLVQFMMKGSKPREGLWIDGKKYMVLRTVQNESASLNSGDTVFTVYAKRPQGGACIAKTNRAMVVGTFDEGFGQTAGLCNQIVIRCATWLKRNGF